MCIKRNLFIVILIFFQISILSQVNMQHLEYVANDYYNNFIVKRNFKYCTVFQYTSDSTYKYNISDDNNPIPIIPPDTFILIHDSILVCYYYNFPPDISKNYQTLNKLKYFYRSILMKLFRIQIIFPNMTLLNRYIISLMEILQPLKLIISLIALQCFINYLGIMRSIQNKKRSLNL